MSGQRLGTIVRLELTQRTRSVAWYVLLGVFALLLLIVTVLSFLAYGYVPDQQGSAIYSTIVYMTLLLIVLVSPTLSGASINGDRDAATLAPVQVTLATTGEIVLGKFLAAWTTGLAFVAVSIPFLVVSTLAGGADFAMIAVSLLILVIEVGVVAAIGVGLSGILARPLFSVATTYLVVAALVIGTLIAFGLLGATMRTEQVNNYRTLDYAAYEDGSFPCLQGETPTDDYPCEPTPDLECGEWESYTYDVPRFDRVWWILAANPFVILADATPTRISADGYPIDLFGQIKFGVRMAQIPPEPVTTFDDCSATPGQNQPQDADEIIASTTPSWFVGLGLQVLLAAGLLWWAWARTNTPARTLPPGTRIA